MNETGKTTHPIRSFYDNMSIPLKEYFKESWKQVTGKNEKTFYNRLDRPQIEDVVIFKHVTGIALDKTLLDHYPEVKKLTPFQGQYNLI